MRQRGEAVVVVVVDHHWTFYAAPARSRLARSRATRSADPPQEALTLRLKWTTSSSGGVLLITSSLSSPFFKFILFKTIMLRGSSATPTSVRDEILRPYKGDSVEDVEDRVVPAELPGDERL